VSRQAQIFVLTHFYPLFIAGLLYREKWDRVALVLVYTIPAFIIIRLFWLWQSSSQIKLNQKERTFIKYFIYTIGFYNAYCLITVFALPKWVYNHNVQAAGFMIITVLFYIFKHSETE